MWESAAEQLWDMDREEAEPLEGEIRLEIHWFAFKLFTFNLSFSSESHCSIFIYLLILCPVYLFFKNMKWFSFCLGQEAGGKTFFLKILIK